MPPTNAVVGTYANCCGGYAEHAALVARLQAMLVRDPSVATMTATYAILRLFGGRRPIVSTGKEDRPHDGDRF
jgi:hypothetical protein